MDIEKLDRGNELVKYHKDCIKCGSAVAQRLAGCTDRTNGIKIEVDFIGTQGFLNTSTIILDYNNEDDKVIIERIRQAFSLAADDFANKIMEL